MNLKRKVLVVEDNRINRMILSGILASEYQVLEAENGQEALNVLKECGEEISLILLDILMPVMDGYTFLSHVKADPAYSSIPVIVITQSDGESDEVTALSHGAADFVAKPYKPQVILHRVASIINLRETSAMIHMIQYDRLTGLYSKEFFYQQAREILIQHPDKEYDIICSDIVNFKLINDIFGIQAGDQLLCGVADLYLRTVGEEGICGHFNADQFACLFERRFDYSEEMFGSWNDQINTLPYAKNIVMKWGVYSITDRTVPIEQMCDRALLAARSLKAQYGKYYAVYDDELRSRLLREQAITDSMEPALEQGQFVIYLQPKYRIKDNQLAGAEALVRWIHPEWGFQSPAQFIPLFERNGFITKLDQYVWRQSCAIMRQWDDKGYPLASVSVNVSRADIYNADLSGTLMKIVQEYGLSPSRLHLEITESAYTEDPGQIVETVGHLRDLGFVIEMDDFGSGYSSLNMLNDMPVDVLKLDMKFIQSETAKPASQGILRFIMELARWMKLSVVAEGVETLEQLERLRDIGCDYVQGYYFAKPMPCDEFEPLVKEQYAAGKKQKPQKTASAGHGECVLEDGLGRDYLTGFLNRRGLDTAAKALDKKDSPLAVYLFDFDHLQQINETYGHLKSDRLLADFSEVLLSHTRGNDVLVRIGGDEFLVIMKHMRSEDSALKRGEEICRAVREIGTPDNLTVSCSAGLALWNGEDAVSEMIDRTNEALNHAKTDNRGGCCLWGRTKG